MADIIDHANELAELHLQASLAKHAEKSSKESAKHCIECDEAIPQKRRNAVAGVQTCIECQSVLEQKNKQGGC